MRTFFIAIIKIPFLWTNCKPHMTFNFVRRGSFNGSVSIWWPFVSKTPCFPQRLLPFKSSMAPHADYVNSQIVHTSVLTRKLLGVITWWFLENNVTKGAILRALLGEPIGEIPRRLWMAGMPPNYLMGQNFPLPSEELVKCKCFRL